MSDTAAFRAAHRSSPFLLSFVVLLLLCLLFPCSSQLITAISGCAVTDGQRTRECSATVVITVSGVFPQPNKRSAPTVQVAGASCSRARQLSNSSVTCSLPPLQGAMQAAVWLPVNISFTRGGSSPPFLGVSYANVTAASSSSSGASRAVVSSSSSIRPSLSSSSARSVSSSTGAWPSPPTILAVSGCVDEGPRTRNCSYSSILTIFGQNFVGSVNSTSVIFKNHFALLRVLAANATHVVCSVPALQFDPAVFVTVRVIGNGHGSNAFPGVNFRVITPYISSLRVGSGSFSQLVRVSPGDMLTVYGLSFPLEQNVYVMLNGTQALSMPELLASNELVCQVPLTLNDALPRDTLLAVTVRTMYAQSPPHMGVVVMRPIGPTILSVSGCEDKDNRTANCLLLFPVPITIVGQRFPPLAPSSVRIGGEKDSVCNVTSWSALTNSIVCTLPHSNFQVGRSFFWQVNVQWPNTEAASFTGISFTDRLMPPELSSIASYSRGGGCRWNTTVFAATNCDRASLLTITGLHFPPYLEPNVSFRHPAVAAVGRCAIIQPYGPVRNTIVCRPFVEQMPSLTTLLVEITVGGVSSRAYPAISFKASGPPAQSSSTGKGGGGGGKNSGGGGDSGNSGTMTLEDEIVITLLVVTSAVLLCIVGVCTAGWWANKRRGNRETEAGGAEGGSELLMNALGGAAPAQRPYVPLAAQFGANEPRPASPEGQRRDEM